MREKMDCHKAERISHGLIFGGLACMLIGLLGAQRGVEPLAFLGIPGMIASPGGLLFGFAFVRCPHCGGALIKGRMPAVPDFCPHCGARLNKEQ